MCSTYEYVHTDTKCSDWTRSRWQDGSSSSRWPTSRILHLLLAGHSAQWPANPSDAANRDAATNNGFPGQNTNLSRYFCPKIFELFFPYSRSQFPLNCAQRQYWHNQFASWMRFDWYLIWTKFYFENPTKWRMQCTIASKSMDCPVCKMVVHGSQWAKWTMARCNHGATDASFHYANHDRDGNNNMIECNHGHTMPNWSSQSKTNKHHRHDQNTLLVAI